MSNRRPANSSDYIFNLSDNMLPLDYTKDTSIEIHYQKVSEKAYQNQGRSRNFWWGGADFGEGGEEYPFENASVLTQL